MYSFSLLRVSKYLCRRRQYFRVEARTGQNEPGAEQVLPGEAKVTGNHSSTRLESGTIGEFL